MTPDRPTRLSAAERRTLVLAAATRAFARSGYAGTSTDAVAREAGVSQPYVVRIFGSKRELFAEAVMTAGLQVRDAFAAEIDRVPFDPGRDADWERLRDVYRGLVTDRDQLLVLMHGFAAAGDPELGQLSRFCMDEIANLVLATGAGPEQVRDFVAHGMLLNVMLAMDAPEHRGEHPGLDVLSSIAFGPSDDAAPDA